MAGDPDSVFRWEEGKPWSGALGGVVVVAGVVMPVAGVVVATAPLSLGATAGSTETTRGDEDPQTIVCQTKRRQHYAFPLPSKKFCFCMNSVFFFSDRDQLRDRKEAILTKQF